MSVPSLVKDINSGSGRAFFSDSIYRRAYELSTGLYNYYYPNNQYYSLFRQGMAVMGNTLFFTASDGINGYELWKSDGTEAGTTLVKNIQANNSSSVPQNLTVVGNTLFFTANSSNIGYELWKSDGTAAGTNLVKDIKITDLWTTRNSFPLDLTAVGNTLFFSANDGSSNGRQLWKSNGTETGTTIVKVIGSYQSSNWKVPSPYPRELETIGNTLFFVTDQSRTFNLTSPFSELWKSDGTEGGTQKIPGAPLAPLGPRNLTKVGNTLFFNAATGSAGRELWKSDGTTAVMVKDISTSLSSSSNPRSLTAVGNTLYFTAQSTFQSGYDLWKSDGTAAGTVRVADLPYTSSSFLVGAENTLFFTVRLSSLSRTGQLWISDGTAVGTKAIASNLQFREMITVGDTLYFSANDGINGFELWKSDGTAAGTVLVDDIYAGSLSSNPQNFAVIGNTLFFSADDGIRGRELWSLDITPNKAPTDLNLSITSVNENVSVGTTVGTFSTTDPDSGNTFTYQLVSGTGSTDNTAFSISENQLRINTSPGSDLKVVVSCKAYRIKLK